MKELHERDLGKLPKGYRCVDYQTVPSRSDYHKSDEIERCAKFAPPGGGGGGRSKKDDSDDDSGDRDGTPAYRDDDGNFTDKRMENAFYWAAQLRGWMIEGPHAGIRGTYCVEIQAGQPIIVLPKDDWNEETVKAITDSMREYDFPPSKTKELDDEFRVFVEPSDERPVSDYADEWRDIDPECTDAHPDGERGDGRRVIDDMGDEPVTLDTDDWELTVEALRFAAAGYSELDRARSAIKTKEAADAIESQSGKTRSLKSQKKGDWKYVVGGLLFTAEQAEVDDDPSGSVDDLRRIAEEITSQADDGDAGGEWPDARNGWERFDPGHAAPAGYRGENVEIVVAESRSGYKVSSEKRRGVAGADVFSGDKDDTVEFLESLMTTFGGGVDSYVSIERWADGWEPVDDRPDPDDVGEWKSQQPGGDPEPDDLGPEVRRWRADYPHPFFEEDSQFVTVVAFESNRGTAYQVYHFIGEVDYDEINQRIHTEEDETDAESVAVEWMEEHPPESVNYDVPGDENGWRRTKFDQDTEYHEHHTEWERWVPPNPRLAERRKERVTLFYNKNKWHVRYGPRDGDGDRLDTRSRALPTLPDKRSMTRGSEGKKESFKSVGRPLDAIREYIDENPSEKTSWPDIPRFTARGKNRNTKPIAELMKRVTDEGTTNLTSLNVTNSALEFVGADSANVAMFDVDLHASSFDMSHKHDPPEEFSSDPGEAGIDVYPLAAEIVDHKMSDEIYLVTQEPREPNDPVMAQVRQPGTTLAETPLWPERETRKPEIPEIDFDASFTIKEARDLNDAAKEATDQICVSAGENRVALLWGEDRNERIILPTTNRTLESDEDTVNACYSQNYIRSMSMSVPRPASTSIDAELSDDHPIKFTYSVGTNHVTYLVAPRIQTEQPEASSPCPFSQTGMTGRKTLKTSSEPPHARMGLAESASAETTDGEPVESLDIDGDAVVYTFPKSLGCRCGTQALQFEELRQTIDINVYGVATADRDELAEFKRKYDLGYTLISDPDAELASAIGVEADESGKLPRTTIFFKNGREVERVEGMTKLSVDPEGAELNQPRELHPFAGYDDFNDCVRSNRDKNDPGAYCGAIKNRVEQLEGHEPPEIVKRVNHPSTYVITGKRGSGKSSLAYTLGEYIHQTEGITPVTIAVPKQAMASLPDHWENVESMEQAPCDCVVVVDEAYRKFNARRPMSSENVDLSQIVNLSRQNDQTILFVSQSTSQLDKNSILEADGTMMKEPGPFHQRFERRGVRDLTETAKESYETLPESADKRKYTYLYTDEFQGLVETPEVDFYNDDLSNTFATTCEPHTVEQPGGDALDDCL